VDTEVLAKVLVALGEIELEHEDIRVSVWPVSLALGTRSTSTRAMHSSISLMIRRPNSPLNTYRSLPVAETQ
jgi:hypothetical protein